MVAAEMAGICATTLFAISHFLNAAGFTVLVDAMYWMPGSLGIRAVSACVVLVGINYLLIRAVIGLDWIEVMIAETPIHLIPEIKRKGVRDIMVPAFAAVLAGYLEIYLMP